jgi:ABC-type antimicrobial peptide transport system permease subunit
MWFEWCCARGLTLATAGIALGTVLAIAGMRLAAGLLVGVSPSDPTILVGSALFLAVIALISSHLPARRATKVDPAVTLRET